MKCIRRVLLSKTMYTFKVSRRKNIEVEDLLRGSLFLFYCNSFPISDALRGRISAQFARTRYFTVSFFRILLSIINVLSRLFYNITNALLIINTVKLLNKYSFLAVGSDEIFVATFDYQLAYIWICDSCFWIGLYMYV